MTTCQIVVALVIGIGSIEDSALFDKQVLKFYPCPHVFGAWCCGVVNDTLQVRDVANRHVDPLSDCRGYVRGEVPLTPLL